MIDLGWTWDQVLDQITLPRLQTLREEWKDWPPVRIMVCLALGHKPPEHKPKGNISELLAMFPTGTIH